MNCIPAIYPGTFDPITNGHISIIRRGLSIFKKLTVAILINPQKKTLFSLDERIEMIQEVTKDLDNIEIDTFDGLLVDYAVQKDVKVILRGLRAMSDFEYEFQLALMNRKLDKSIESVFLMTDYKWFYISSTIVKEAAKFGADIKDLVPEMVYRRLQEKFR